MNYVIFLFRLLKYFLSLLMVPLFIWGSVCEARNHLSDIRYWSSPTFTRIVLDLKSEPRFDSFSLVKPDRLVVDLKNFDGQVPKKLLTINDGIVKKIRASQKSKGTIRIVVDLAKKSDHKIFPLKKISTKLPRLVIDITRPDLEEADRFQREETRKRKKKGNYIVVIDPGHGGEDPGAVGKKKTKEKDIVFAIAKKLAWKLNHKKGVKAYLTRKGDYFISLKKRIEITKQYGADLFISIHADSSFSKKVYGSSVYCLSFKGASSNTAKMVAAKENASDFIGGVPLDHQNHDLNAIIFDLVQTHNLNSSLHFAGLTLKEISKVNKLHTKRPHQAGFAVLTAPDIPSILIETDFISNPRREKRMKTAWFQNEFANRIAIATSQFLFLGKQDPRKQRSVKPRSIYHVVKRGETLSSIAIKYNTTVHDLRRLNGMSAKSTLRAGKKLKVIPGEKAKDRRPKLRYHVVKRGETLSSIAIKYNTTVHDLRRLNGMSAKSTLRAGKKLKVIPGEKAKDRRPKLRYHVVKRGETLSSIAKKYQTTVNRLCKLNGMSTKSTLRAGKKLRVL